MKVDPKRVRSLIAKLGEVRDTTNKHILERTVETDGILLAILSKTSGLFLGNVGTAKTEQIRLISKLLELRSFDILLSATTKPDAIFGPTDIPALAKGVQRTKIKGYAPDAEVIFFDELFRANDVVLNPLLWLVNERQYRNGDEGIINCPTQAVFAATNEIPNDPSLTAIYDRFLLRFEVGYLKDASNMRKMINNNLGKKKTFTPILDRDEVEELQEYTNLVEVPKEVQNMAIKIRDQIHIACAEDISDRRLSRSIKLLQANALLNGRKRVTGLDADVLSYVFWNKPEHQTRVMAIAMAHSSSDYADVLSYRELAESIWDKAVKTGDFEDGYKKLKGVYETCEAFGTKSGVKIATEVLGMVRRAKNVLDQRKQFTVLRIEDEEGVWYKAAVASALAYNKDQLRSVGFKWSRLHQYWWYQGDGKKLKKAIETKFEISPRLKRIGGSE
jgi:MoxR-like ATPase